MDFNYCVHMVDFPRSIAMYEVVCTYLTATEVSTRISCISTSIVAIITSITLAAPQLIITAVYWC